MEPQNLQYIGTPMPNPSLLLHCRDSGKGPGQCLNPGLKTLCSRSFWIHWVLAFMLITDNQESLMAKTQDRIMTTLCSYLLPNTEVISNKTPMWSVSGKWEQGLLSPQPLLLCQPAVKMMAPLMTTHAPQRTCVLAEWPSVTRSPL